MKRIKVLPERVINHIAAGEIIERPASVVKELMENSVDANADSIKVVIEDGGKKSITVIDNGSGMNKDDALLALERHATSKVYSLDDIEDISTLGFRGEALPSIASVSQMELKTLSQQQENEPGILIKIDFGDIKNVSKAATTPGTSISVKNLFAKIPARKKFLKTTRTEFSHIKKVFNHISITNPDISFTLIHNGNQTYNYPGANLIEKRISQIFGDTFFHKQIISIHNESPHITLDGYIGSFREESALGNIHNIFINNRYIKDRIVYTAIKKAYEPFTKKTLKKNQIPVYVIFMQIDNEKIDFNVSPTKEEVRFFNSNYVFQFVKKTVTDHLLNYEKDKFTEKQAKTGTSQTNKKFQAEKSGNQTFSSYQNQLDELFKEPRQDRDVQQVNFFDQNIAKDKNRIIEYDIVNPWQVGDSFIMVETKDGILVIDQHAAHERILYEKVKKNMSEDKHESKSQKLLFPLVLDLPKYLSEVIPDLLERHSALFKKAGFNIKVFSGNSIVVEEIPSYLKNWDKDKTMLDIFKNIENEFDPEMEFEDNLAKSTACHAAIKVNQKLTKKEMLRLINELFAAKNPFVCPHGRPTVIEISFSELYNRFKRT